jgi:methyl-accepting chemotaxis protein
VAVGASRYLELVGALEVRRQPALALGMSQSISLIADKGAESRDRMVLVFGLVILAVLVTGLALARMLLRPIRLLVEACRAVAAGDLSREVPLVSSDETALLTLTFNESLRGLRERDRARDAFGRYVDPELRSSGASCSSAGKSAT